MRRRPRVDANHAEIVQAFRSCGWSVLSLAGLGDGVPDLLCAKFDRMMLVEVKTAKGKLTQDQRDWQANWHGPAPVIVRSTDDVVNVATERTEEPTR